MGRYFTAIGGGACLSGGEIETVMGCLLWGFCGRQVVEQ